MISFIIRWLILSVRVRDLIKFYKLLRGPEEQDLKTVGALTCLRTVETEVTHYTTSMSAFVRVWKRLRLFGSRGLGDALASCMLRRNAENHRAFADESSLPCGDWKWTVAANVTFE